MNKKADPQRYSKMTYRRCGSSGISLPLISLGLWQNFGFTDSFQNQRKMIAHAFDTGITHFDLANNYGPPPYSAEINFGKILHQDFKSHRDEWIISTKAGYWGWDGPYGDGGSRKYLISSLDQSLKRMKIDYVDIFYHHRPDPQTPLEETMGALEQIVRQGKALYVGISNYRGKEASEAFQILKSLGIRCLIHQPRYNLLDRWIEKDLISVLKKEKIGCIPFSPLAQGFLTDRYLNGIPKNSRIGKKSPFLKKEQLTPEILNTIQKLNKIASKRGQSLAQMSLAWILRLPEITSVLIGASSTQQLQQNLDSLKHLDFSREELSAIDQALK